jgi:ATP synthase F1 complex assembly factor 1
MLLEICQKELKMDRKEPSKCISLYVPLFSSSITALTSIDDSKEWAFLPPPSNISEPVPSPSTVLFTPLAEYKSRAAFAQPYLILTHYTDLSKSHGVVLMRGEISDSVALGGTDAQVLSVRLQLFYNPSGEGGDRELARFKLLEDFHERPEKFDLDKLVQIAWEL